MRVIVTEYQPAWVEQFEEEAQALKQILKENCLKVEHIGSTSVPNLAAKPIIDFLVIVEEIEKVDLLQGEFERIGYEYMGEFGLSGRRYLRKGPIKRTHHVHIYQFDNTQEILRHLAFRNYLRENPAIATTYLVFRHPRNAKWFALIMPLDAQLLGATENKQLTILTVKFAPELIALLKNQPGYFPAYHMNKEHWLSLSEEIPLSQVFSFIDESYQRSY